MAESIRFTDELEMRLLTHFDQHWFFQLYVPTFVWVAHGHIAQLDSRVEPVFYISNAARTPTLAAGWLLRGAAEAICEEAWDTYRELVDNGISDQLVRQILPANLMSQGLVTWTTAELLGFVEKHREDSVHEMALIAGGYERALNGDRNAAGD